MKEMIKEIWMEYNDNNQLIKYIGCRRNIQYHYENGLKVLETEDRGPSVTYIYNEHKQLIKELIEQHDEYEPKSEIIYEYDEFGNIIHVYEYDIYTKDPDDDLDD